MVNGTGVMGQVCVKIFIQNRSQLFS